MRSQLHRRWGQAEKRESEKAREKGNVFSPDLNTATESLLPTVSGWGGGGADARGRGQMSGTFVSARRLILGLTGTSVASRH